LIESLENRLARPVEVCQSVANVGHCHTIAPVHRHLNFLEAGLAATCADVAGIGHREAAKGFRLPATGRIGGERVGSRGALLQLGEDAP
jgi:hypothetical protein